MVGRWHAQEFTAVCQFPFPVSVAREAVVVADASEAVRQHVQQEAADKLFGLLHYRFLLGIVVISL